MRFDKDKLSIEIVRLISELEVSIDESKYPQLSKMKKRGSELNWAEYLNGERKK